jgi:hypothetical protein
MRSILPSAKEHLFRQEKPHFVFFPENKKKDWAYLAFDSFYGITFSVTVSFNVAAAAHFLDKILKANKSNKCIQDKRRPLPKNYEDTVKAVLEFKEYFGEPKQKEKIPPKKGHVIRNAKYVSQHNEKLYERVYD